MRASAQLLSVERHRRSTRVHNSMGLGARRDEEAISAARASLPPLFSRLVVMGMLPEDAQIPNWEKLLADASFPLGLQLCHTLSTKLCGSQAATSGARLAGVLGATYGEKMASFQRIFSGRWVSAATFIAHCEAICDLLSGWASACQAAKHALSALQQQPPESQPLLLVSADNLRSLYDQLNPLSELESSDTPASMEKGVRAGAKRKISCVSRDSDSRLWTLVSGRLTSVSRVRFLNLTPALYFISRVPSPESRQSAVTAVRVGVRCAGVSRERNERTANRAWDGIIPRVSAVHGPGAAHSIFVP